MLTGQSGLLLERRECGHLNTGRIKVGKLANACQTRVQQCFTIVEVAADYQLCIMWPSIGFLHLFGKYSHYIMKTFVFT